MAVKGGERAIRNAHRRLAERRRGDPAVPELSLEQIREQLGLAVDRAMCEGALYDPRLAALALKQARGDSVEAAFLLRVFRNTLPRFGYSEPLDTGAMAVERRVSGAFKDLPGGQLLGATADYTHRLLDFALEEPQQPAPPGEEPEAEAGSGSEATGLLPRALAQLGEEALIEAPPADEGAPVPDITRDPPLFPAERAQRLQTLARGDEGFLVGLAYSSQRGYGNTHPFVGELRQGRVAVELVPEELGFAVEIGEIEVSELETVNQFTGDAEHAPCFTRGYGLAFGRSERKALAMALLDRSLRAEELGEELGAPAQDQEFVLEHADNILATGFMEHLKLPHHVDFQAERELLRALRRAWEERRSAPEAAE
ncbi:carbon-phosphorus lyase complex subunit PhnI [Tistlia consotensis]|uniref:carbon-phosphorus lyase complex subunit PhnI n=1 Tax=Tistlia consotensis TaxID=1321365 RepID=UPI003F58C35C